jgi:CarD family transcriptional regulator
MIEICQINLLRGEKDMYNVGDEVVYPMHGAGRIVAIEEREVMEEKQSYYILEMPGEVKVMIPTATAEEHGIRSVINKEEAQKVMSVLEQDETEMEKNWNKRYRENIYEIADVVRNLSFKQKEKGLSTGEKKMLYNAKQILVSELVFAENSTQNEVEELIDSKINSSYAMFRTDEGEIGKASAGSIVNKFIPFNG